MKKFYDIKDIQSFLMENKYIWNGKQYDDLDGYKNIGVEAFHNHFGIDVQLTTFDDDELYRYLGVRSTYFSIMYACDEGYDSSDIIIYLDKDLSKEWVEFLVKKNGKAYAEEVKAIMDANIENTKEALQNEISLYQTKIDNIKKKYGKKLKEYEEINKLVSAATEKSSQLGEE